MRLSYIDYLRVLAILCMVIFHGSYDMRMMGFVDWDFSQGFWWAFPRGIAFSFLFCVGLSLNLSHRPFIRWNSLLKRSLKIGFCALLVSIGTYFMFPDQWIYFGTLHCILVGSILGALVVNHRPLAWALLILILLGQYGLDYDIKWVSTLTQRHSMDFIPIYPWFWAILAGILTEPYLSKTSFFRRLPEFKFLTFVSRHSLKIYMVHQPLLLGALYLVKLITRQ